MLLFNFHLVLLCPTSLLCTDMRGKLKDIYYSHITHMYNMLISNFSFPIFQLSFHFASCLIWDASDDVSTVGILGMEGRICNRRGAKNDGGGAPPCCSCMPNSGLLFPHLSDFPIFQWSLHFVSTVLPSCLIWDGSDDVSRLSIRPRSSLLVSAMSKFHLSHLSVKSSLCEYSPCKLFNLRR